MTDGGVSSGVAKSLAQFGDRYERNARLAPALLVLLPAIVAVVALYGKSLGVLGTISATVGMCGGWVLLADFARSRGKAREKALWEKWGGPPSTQVLRHADQTFDAISKERYHAFIGGKLGRTLPSSAEEAKDVAAADALYSSAANWLREQTRDDKKFHLLKNDNIAYGFRRNGYALRWLGIAVCLICGGWLLFRHGFAPFAQRLNKATDAEVFFSGGEWISLAVAGGMLLAWLGFFTEATVRAAAFSYAEKLMLACEVLKAVAPTRKTTVSKASAKASAPAQAAPPVEVDGAMAVSPKKTVRRKKADS